MRRRVVITGMGTISAIGLNTEQFWSGLLSGKSGVVPITKFDTEKFPTKIAAELQGFIPEDHFEKNDVRKIDPYAQYAMPWAYVSSTPNGLEIPLP